MRFTKACLNLAEGINREWLITNGIGGYASSTMLGINTRKYHGLLVAPFSPPGRRFLILSKLDEAIIVKGTKHNLFSNMCENYISEGFKNQVSFEKDNYPVFEYQVEDIQVNKKVVMKHGENTVCIKYTIQTGKNNVKLELAPIVNFRDFHTVNEHKDIWLGQEVKNKKIKLVVGQNSESPIYILNSDGEYEEYSDVKFENMFYIEEDKRGFFPYENHVVPGVYKINIPKHTTKEIKFICSTSENIDEIEVDDVFEQEDQRLKELTAKTGLIKPTSKFKDKEELKTALIKATDNFIVYRPSFGLHTVIAGYHWFLDWGRDTLISFEGLLLMTRRFDIAKEVLQTIAKDIKFGLVPNGYSGFDNRPLYNSADSSLLLFEQVQKYLNYTDDEDFVRSEIYDYLVTIIQSYQKGIEVDDNNIYLDKDGLLVSGTEKTQNTWMDAKYGDMPATPRNGKVVELNALWYNALNILERLAIKFKDKKTAKYCNELYMKHKDGFVKQFYNTRKKCLFDVIGDSKVRPNQLFTLSLTYPVIDITSEIAENIINTVNKKLLMDRGLKTLAKGEENYIEIYEGNAFKRDMTYHQGTTWVWLLGLYSDTLKNRIKAETSKTKKAQFKKEYDLFVDKVIKTFYDEIFFKGCIGQLSEMYDSKKPYAPKGAIAQAWSIAEILRIIV